jgi:hypothetical protein
LGWFMKTKKQRGILCKQTTEAVTILKFLVNRTSRDVFMLLRHPFTCNGNDKMSMRL